MKRLAVLALTTVAACSMPAPQRGAPPEPLPAPLRSGIDRGNFDPAVRPQDDLYRAVNGGWMARTQIPADKASYGAFTELDDRAEAQLRDIIEAAAAGAHPAGSDEQKVGDYYRAFMDEARVNALGLKPLAEPLSWIAGLQRHEDLPELLARLAVIGVNYFPAYIAPDAKQSSQYIAYFEQGGIGLPDRDFYLQQDEKFAGYRSAYREHVARMLALAGERDAPARAREILALETRLAEAQWTQVDSRDADRTYNKFDDAGLRAVLPNFDFVRYLETMDARRSPGVILSQPGFFTAWDLVIHATPLPVLRSYLTWHLLHAYAPYLPQPFVDENFDFYGRSLRGIETLKPRWKRGVDAVEGALGEVLGRLYVARHFPPEAQQRMERLVDNLLAAYADSIRELDWMSAPTKARALEKLARFETKIGYPKKWKDYSALVVKPDDLLGNVMRSAAVEHAREIAKLGRPIDRDEWFMTPQTVNAYYNPTMNEIVFPAAILQPPFFDLTAEDAVNYGAIGGVIGHEIGHGFDDQGSKFDGDGNLKSWWTEEDRARFEARAQKLIEQYDRYEPIPGHKVNGALTVGENIGDLGGLAIAWRAWQRSLQGKPAPVIDGFTGEERFFIGWAQSWRRKQREADLVERLKTDPHAPDEYRCNGVVVNLPAVPQTDGTAPGDGMWLPPAQRVSIW